MNNLTNYGKRYISKYLRDYAAGKLHFSELIVILDVCFKQRLNIN